MSISAAKRLIKQGAVEVNGQIVLDWHYKLRVGDKIKIGKKVFLTVVDKKHGNSEQHTGDNGQ